MDMCTWLGQAQNELQPVGLMCSGTADGKGGVMLEDTVFTVLE